MKVGSDLRNVYIWDTAREHLAALALKMMTEGQVGRKQSPVSLGDAASLAIFEACERRGLDTAEYSFRSLKMERGGAGQTVTGDPGLDGGLCSVCDGLKRHGV